MIRKEQILNPISWLQIIKFKELIKKKWILPNIVNYSASLIFRFVNKVKILTRILNKLRNSIDIENVDQFWIIRIGFLRRRNFLPYINLDPYMSNLMDCFFTRMPCFCAFPWNIPLGNNSCQLIHIKYFFRYFNSKKIYETLKKWHNILIPGGKLKIGITQQGNENKIVLLKELLAQNNFCIEGINEFDLKINGTITISATKQIKKTTPEISISNQKIKEILLILNQKKSIFFDKRNICVLGYQSNKIKRFFKSLILDSKEILFLDTHINLFNIPENEFELIVIQNYFEYCNPNNIIETLNEVKRVLKEKTTILVIIPEKKFYFSRETTHLFEKSIILKYIDNSNLLLKEITLSSSFKMIQILIKNQDYLPTKKIEKKIVLLGNYALRYTYLINARWDTQARAFERLGYNILILDIKDNSFNFILKRIKLFNPDILWTGGKLVIEFLKENHKFFEKSKIKVIYWLWDVKTPITYDFRDIIDYMFVTTKDDIPKYQQTYNIDNLYWMPASITPEIIQKNEFIEEIYDIGFAGSLDKRFHKKRTEIVEFIQQHFNVKFFSIIYNNLPEYYSQCRIVLGGSPDQKDLELYMSNRIFVCMACSSCFLTNYFKGLKLLAENEKHLIWYNTKEEIVSLIKKYLSNQQLRENIGKNARILAEEKHNYLSRIENMLDIINGKTNKFYGFIN